MSVGGTTDLRATPPSAPEEIEAALRAGGARDLKWALAHRRAFATETDLAARVEEAVTELVASSDARALIDLAAALHVYWPQGFTEARIRGAVHLALELGQLGARELYLLLQPLLADDVRFDVFVRHAESRALGGRLRVAELSRGVALASTFVGSRSAVVPGERGDTFERTLELLYKDRDPGVGMRAAFAAGVLASKSPRMNELCFGKPGAKPARAGLEARRQMAARTARWILGEEDDERYLAELRTGLGKTDVFVRWAAVQAMQMGARLAPDTCADAVESLIAGSAPEVLAAAASFARALPDDARRDALLERILAEARGKGERALRVVSPPQAPAAAEMLRDLEALRVLLVQSPRSGHAESEALLGEVRAAALSLKSDGDSGADDVDLALDQVLLDGPVLRDALIASAKDDDERVRRYRAWAQAVAALALPRLARCEAGGEPAEMRERFRRLGRALDAHPQREAEADGFLDVCAKVARSLFARAAGDAAAESTALDRPIAVALAAAVEPLLAKGRLLPTELVAATFGARTPALAKHLAASLSSAELASALAAASALGVESLAQEKPPAGARRPDAKGERVAAAVRELAARTSALGATETTARACRALDAAASAVVRAARAGTGTPLVPLFRDALVGLARAQAEAEARLGLASLAPGDPRDPPEKLDRALYSLLVAEHLVPILPSERTYGDDRAAGIVARSTPPLFKGLFAALLAEVRAITLSQAAVDSERPRASHFLAPGKTIADYVVDRVLGSGGMGHCVLVRRRLEKDSKTARRWVLKVPQSTDYVDAFRNEALALLMVAKVKHPAIVRFVSYVDYGYRLPFLVMEYVEGEALDKRLARGAMGAREVCSVGEKLAEGIAKSHALRVSHHDIKPGNIVLAGGGGPAASGVRPVLVDWGLAGAAYPWAGTPEYMAPERFDFTRGASSASKDGAAASAAFSGAADVWALGCVLVEMLAGRPFLCEPLTPRDVGAHADAIRVLRAYEAVDAKFRRSYACEALAKNPPLLENRLAEVLGNAASPALVALLLSMLSPRMDARPSAELVARKLAELSEKA